MVPGMRALGVWQLRVARNVISGACVLNSMGTLMWSTRSL